MNPSSPKGFALFLVFVGIVLALTGVIGSMVTGNQRQMLIALVGFAVQFFGWRRHSAQREGWS